jgi:hypothetical protein
MALHAFATVGRRIPRWLRPQLLLGMRWLHEHLASEYRLDC